MQDPFAVLDYYTAKPFLRWLGSKSSLVPEIMVRKPESINNYYEPFLGGGSLFFALGNQVKGSYLSDINSDLINAYLCVRDELDNLIPELELNFSLHSENHYRKVCHCLNAGTKVQNAARLIYLQKTCFGGRYRVNGDGVFNNTLSEFSGLEDDFYNNLFLSSKLLKLCSIEMMDYVNISPKQGDFVYFDPPYHGSEIDYSQGFTYLRQIQLRDYSKRLTDRGVNLMISNSQSDLVEGLYRESIFNIDSVKVTRSYGGGLRKEVEEFLIMNY